MSEPLQPFRSDRYEIGASRDGHTLTLQPMTTSAAELLGPQTAAIGPWAHYGSNAGSMTVALKRNDDGAIRYQVRCGTDLAGAVVVYCPWLAGPYLQLLAVMPAHQNRGIGASVLSWLESEARCRYRNLWLCVSAFNVDAQRFYRAHGFERVATLQGLLRDGDDELLMRKRLPP
jgi:ribosomal protein S18 acetylase RimI-like enzyme